MLDQHRSVQRHVPTRREDKDVVTTLIIQLASQFGRYGYRKVTGLLRNAGWCINHKRVERIWREERLKVPPKQPKRGRLWLTTMDRVCGFAPSIAITFGRMTSSRTGPTTGERFACSP